MLRSDIDFREMYRLLDLSKDQKLSILDIGCGGGPDALFTFLNNAYFIDWMGVDFNLTEIEQLRTKFNDLPNFIFTDAKIITTIKTFSKKNPWNQLSAAAMADILMNRDLSHKEKIDNNFINEQMGFSFSQNSINAEELRQYLNTDLIKIDFDSENTFAFLQEYFNSFQLSSQMPGVAVIEVDFYGDHLSDTNTFHNVDRFMRSRNYILGGLTVRTYSDRFMPGIFQYDIAAQTLNGIPFQGDAVYFLDFDQTIRDKEDFTVKIKKTALLLVSLGLHDVAVRIINKFIGDSYVATGFVNYLASHINVPASNDYKTLIDKFNKNDDIFWPTKVQVDEPNMQNVKKNSVLLRYRNRIINVAKRIFKSF